MSTVTIFSPSDIQRATLRIETAREFEKQFGNWADIAKVCYEIERDHDFEVFGYRSWNEWLAHEMPRSRSYIYLVVGRYKELSVDIPDEELAQIPLGNTGVLKQLSPAIRRESKIRQGAKGKPAEFREMVAKEYSGQHIEPLVEQRLRFTLSAWQRIEAAWEAYKLVDPDASLETFLEWCVSEQTT